MPYDLLGDVLGFDFREFEKEFDGLKSFLFVLCTSMPGENG
jgi:hypothetical protein